MSNNETRGGGIERLLPYDLDSIIPDGLVPSGYPGSDTDKYFVPGCLHLLVRHSRGGEPIYALRYNADFYNQLADHGINAVPYMPQEHKGQAYVITLNVTGENLEDILEAGADDDMVAQIDELWHNLISYVSERKREDKAFVHDIFAPQQYMYGTIRDETEPRLWLVDLGGHVGKFSNKPGRHDYEDELLHLVNTVLSLESRLGQPLERCHTILGYSLETMRVPRFREGARAALEHGVQLDLPDDIDDFWPEPAVLGTTE